MPHKRAKKSLREQQKRERSALIRFPDHVQPQAIFRVSFDYLEAQISPHPATTLAMAWASVLNAFPSLLLACGTPRGSAKNIGRRSVQGCRWKGQMRMLTITILVTHRSSHLTKNVVLLQTQARV